MRKSAITRIVLFSVLILLLVGLLGSALLFHAAKGWGGILGLFGQDYISFDEDEEGMTPDNYLPVRQGETILIPAEAIDEIEVDWISGDVILVPGDTDSIQIQETPGKEPMVYTVGSGKLEIRFQKNMKKVSFGPLDTEPKDLTITVPQGWQGRNVEIQSVSADVEIRDLTLENVEYQGVSGTCDFKNCVIRELNVETVSGNVSLEGQIQELDCDSVSADCNLILTNVPREISMDGVSGRLTLTLPQDAGFTVDMDGIRKDLDTDFAVTGRNGKFIAGDGSCQISVDGVNGSVRILKGNSAN